MRSKFSSPKLAAVAKHRRITDKVIFSHLGRVKREDVIPQLADFCLQVEGVDWSVVSGVHNGSLIVSVRNVGFVRAAGDVVKEDHNVTTEFCFEAVTKHVVMVSV